MKRQGAEHGIYCYFLCVLGEEKHIYIYVVTAQADFGKIFKKLLIVLAFRKRIELKKKGERKISFSLCILLYLLSFVPDRLV